MSGYIPDFFKLLCNLLDENLKPEDRRKINSALAYFVILNDAMSEEIYGPLVSRQSSRIKGL